MFTGIVGSAEITELDAIEGGLRLGVRFPKDFPVSGLGDSIAIDGACLSVTEVAGELYYFFVSPETIDKTIIKHYRAGRKVNVELPLRPIDRLGGHYVLGHVDGVGQITNIQVSDASWVIEVLLPKPLSKYVVYKGSVAINGISLTVNAVDGDRISLCIIPVTLEKTNIRALKIGHEVNLEMDILAKYAEKLMPIHASTI